MRGFHPLATTLAATLAAVALLACEERQGGTPEAAAAPGAEAAASDEGLLPGTPAGGLTAWIEDIHGGLEDLPAVAARDASAARRQALDLYIGRQEYIELYFGAAGTLAGGAELDAAVDSAEARFHDLMQLVGQAPVDSVAAAAALGALRDAHERVLELARAHSPALDPRETAEAPR